MLRRFLWIVLFSFSLPLLPAAGAKHLTIEDVRRMAFDKGVVTLKEIELDHGLWEVRGRDATGHKVEMKVDAASGEIVKMRRND